MGIKRKERDEEYSIITADDNNETSNPKIKQFKEEKLKEQIDCLDTSKEKNADKKDKKKNKDSKNFDPSKWVKKSSSGTDFKAEEKVDWKKLKTDLKQLKVKRKQKEDKESSNETYQIGVKAKKIWEEVRREDCKGDKKEKLIKELYGMIKGKVKSLIFAHDTVRVIETIVSAGSEEYRAALFEELKDDLHALIKNKYSRFFVLKQLRYGPKNQKEAIINSFNGHVIEFMKHKVACDVVELAYNDFANSKQRAFMVQEFFGPHFRLFKDPEIHTVEDAIKKHPEKKEMILKDLSTSLQPIIDKGVFTNSMIHTLIKEYLTNCKEADKSAFIESLRENLLPIIHTRDGARVTMLCIWHGNNKDKKTILKSFKGHFQKIATEEFGYMVLLAAVDCVDDTVFLKKAILTELLSDMKYLLASDFGRRVVKYLTAPRSKLFFHPDIIKVLATGDENSISKKDPETRRKEIFTIVSEPILQLIDENINEWAFDRQWTLFIGAALLNLNSEASESIFTKLATLCSEPYIPGEKEHILEVSHTNKMISYIIQCDKQRAAINQPIFCKYLLEHALSEFPGWTLTNRGCFLLVKMIETEIPDVVSKVTDVISSYKKKLAKQDTPGAKILASKLK